MSVIPLGLSAVEVPTLPGAAARELALFPRCHFERSEESALRSAFLSGRAMRRCCAFVFAAMISLVPLAAFAQKQPPAEPIDINTAGIEQLQQLPGIGPATAKSIVEFRKKSGPFRRPEELLAIRGISANRFKAMAPYVVALPPPKPPHSAAAGKAAAGTQPPPSSK